MRELARRKRARVVAAAALVVAMALGVTAQTTATAETPATVLPTNPPTCTAKALGVSRASNPGLAADCDTLLAIQSTLRVSGWINYDTPSWWDHSYALNWSAHTPLRHWRAVTLGGTPQRVIGLDFSDTRESVRVFNARTRQWEASQPFTREWTLRGVIPTQLGNLTALETLDLGGSELTGAVPTQLGSLTALTSLDLSDNALSGGLPAGLRNLPPTLATLRLAGNAVTGCLDERLRLATTNDLATLMQARSLSWCPVTEMLGGVAITAGTYHVLAGLIVDIPADGPRVRFATVMHADTDDPSGGGTSYCLSDLADLELLCLSADGKKSWRGPSFSNGDFALPDVSTDGVPAGLGDVFDKIAATARSAP